MSSVDKWVPTQQEHVDEKRNVGSKNRNLLPARATGERRKGFPRLSTRSAGLERSFTGTQRSPYTPTNGWHLIRGVTNHRPHTRPEPARMDYSNKLSGCQPQQSPSSTTSRTALMNRWIDNDEESMYGDSSLISSNSPAANSQSAKIVNG